jgi:DNA-binding CsgD family transcriptional regulator
MKPLTPTEKRVLDLVGQGMSSTQIAHALNVSAHTIESHRRNMLTKFGAKNSAELMKKAIYAEVLSPQTTQS